MYVYIQSEPRLWTVGHYNRSGAFIPESDHGTPESAGIRVSTLNGGVDIERLTTAIAAIVRSVLIEEGIIPAPRPAPVAPRCDACDDSLSCINPRCIEERGF